MVRNSTIRKRVMWMIVLVGLFTASPPNRNMAQNYNKSHIPDSIIRKQAILEEVKERNDQTSEEGLAKDIQILEESIKLKEATQTLPSQTLKAEKPKKKVRKVKCPDPIFVLRTQDSMYIPIVEKYDNYYIVDLDKVCPVKTEPEENKPGFFRRLINRFK